MNPSDPHPPVEPMLLRRLLGCFPTGVAIVTTCNAHGLPVGLTCNSFSAVSLEPPLVLFSLRRASGLLDTFLAADAFAVNVLSQAQDGLSSLFASRVRRDQFNEIGWRPGQWGTPLIDDCLARFECQVRARHEAGDHVIFIGEVVHLEPGCTEEALVFYKGGYMALAGAPAPRAMPAACSAQAASR
ncbi:flavin reductase family protein [Ramlibacter rhizophilus]|uniref:Flavin reductase n=1 Tax=Ramlibacter rhizophilus TaxID=1781167 RepID=A0A4Z0BQQ8_9BURK|nr:flavin reductase family protein [Ramlibacter rhizophilus]TFZ01171.1 flavin reductase [Ramlibacter rhizophilus]